MAYIDEFGIGHGVDNSFFTLIGRMFTDIRGLLLFFIPLLALMTIFFPILYRRKNKKYLIRYSIIAVIAYILYLLVITRLFLAV